MGTASSARDGADRTVEAEKADDTLRKFCINDIDDETWSIEEMTGFSDELRLRIIDQAIAYLNQEDVLLEEGLFRVSGNDKVIRFLRARFIAGENVNLDEVLHPHTIAGLLKALYREMKFPVIPSDGKLAAELAKSVQSSDVQLFSTLIATIEPHHLARIIMLAKLLAKIVANSAITKMTSQSLATCCALSIFSHLPQNDANSIIMFLVDHCAEIFT